MISIGSPVRLFHFNECMARVSTHYLTMAQLTRQFSTPQFACNERNRMNKWSVLNAYKNEMNSEFAEINVLLTLQIYVCNRLNRNRINPHTHTNELEIFLFCVVCLLNSFRFFFSSNFSRYLSFDRYTNIQHPQNEQAHKAIYCLNLFQASSKIEYKQTKWLSQAKCIYM